MLRSGKCKFLLLCLLLEIAGVTGERNSLINTASNTSRNNHAYIIALSIHGIGTTSLAEEIVSIGFQSMSTRAYSHPNPMYQSMFRFCVGYGQCPGTSSSFGNTSTTGAYSTNELSRICSHRSIWDIIASDPAITGQDWSLIFEADAVIRRGKHNPQELLMSSLADPRNIKRGFVCLGLCGDHLCSHAYAVTKTFASTMYRDIISPSVSLCSNLTLGHLMRVYFDQNGVPAVVGDNIHSTDSSGKGLFYKRLGSDVSFDNVRPLVATYHSCYRHSWTGRLGNLMFQYASLVGTCVKNYWNPYSCVEWTTKHSSNARSKWLPLNKFHQLFSIPHVDCPSNRRSYREHGDRRSTGIYFDPHISEQTSGTSIEGWLLSFKLFHPHGEAAIRKLFTFSPQVMQEAHTFLDTIRNSLPSQQPLICIHIRLEDQARYPRWSFTSDYYMNALNIFVKDKNNTAIVYFVGGTAKDERWVRTNVAVHLPTHQHFFSFNLPDTVCLYALSTCENIVVGDSTFSWWTAYLAGHSSVVAPVKDQPNFVQQDYYPPHWMVIGPNTSQHKLTFPSLTSTV